MKYEQMVLLREDVEKAREAGTIPALVVELDEQTIDGYPVRVGMTVTDYDMKRTTVVGIAHVANDGTVWYETGTGMFDAKRMWAVKP
jgi:hypothetical protein